MTMRTPPGIATWLLLRLGSDRYAGSLAGDLCEEYQNGRSRAWYWQQVALSIFLAHTGPLRTAVLKIMDCIVAIFALLALGAGTIAWANVVNHPSGNSPQALESRGQ